MGLGVRQDLARRLGYSGKFAIHPAQVEVIEEIFSPTGEEIERARRVLEAARVGELRDVGVFHWMTRWLMRQLWRGRVTSWCGRTLISIID